MNRCILYLSCLILSLLSCSKITVEENEEELITTLVLTFSSPGSPSLTYEFDDADGPGGLDPIQDQIVLAANKSYQVTLALLNRSIHPEEDLTGEVVAEADAHRFYFEPSTSVNIAVSSLNTDANGIPLGTISTWITGSPSTGTVKITLRHYANDPPSKAVNDPVNSQKSSTDMEVTFDAAIQ